MSEKRYKVVLSIAGSDSSAGAGIQADLKTVSACECYATTVITAITAQNTKGVDGVERISPEMVRRQIDAVIEDIHIDAVKIGMIPSAEIAWIIAEAIRRYKLPNVVLDPVMISTSGHTLVADAVANTIIDELFPLATLVTPNIPEAEFFSGKKIHSEAEFAGVADVFFRQNCQAVLLKAGHLENDLITDVLFEHDTDRRTEYNHPRIYTANTHGTGCSLSSAIAAYLARGYDLPEACRKAEKFIYKAIKEGAVFHLGEGNGPIHHFHNFW